MILLEAVLMMVLYVLIIVGGLCYIGQRWRHDRARFAHANVYEHSLKLP
jgi:hypothetical protein